MSTQKFKCPNCGQENNIEFDANETSRVIPCLGCYGEEWVPAEVDDNPATFAFSEHKYYAYLKEGYPEERAKELSMVATNMKSDATIKAYGVKLKVVKGEAPDCTIHG